MQSFLEAIEKIPLLWRKTIWGETFLASLGSVPIIANPRFPNPRRLTFELVRIKNRLFVKYTAHTVEQQVGYIALRDVDELQAILQEAVRLAGEQGEVIEEEENTGALVEKSRLSKLGNFAGESLVGTVVIGLWGAGLAWFFGVASLTVWLICGLVGLALGVVNTGILRGWQAIIPSGERSRGLLFWAGVGMFGLLFILLGSFVGIGVAIVGLEATASAVAWFNLHFTPIEAGLFAGVITHSVVQVVNALRLTETQKAPLQVLLGLSSGVRTGMLAASLLAWAGIVPTESTVWAMVGGLLALSLFTPPPAAKSSS